MKNYTITVNGTVYEVSVEEAAQEALLYVQQLRRQHRKQLRRQQLRRQQQAQLVL